MRRCELTRSRRHDWRRKLPSPLVIAVTLFMAIGLVGCLPGETVEATYSNMADAAKAGAIERGWIPDWLPKEAVDLREKHNLDSNASILRISVSESTLQMPLACQDATSPPPATLSADWWPADIHQSPAVYRCADSYVVTDGANGHVYVWRP